jgi:hypothetical protein
MSEASGLTDSAVELSSRRLYCRAIEAAIWGIPLVASDCMRQSFFRDAQAQEGDVVYSMQYVYIHCNLKSGPIVLDLPATKGSGLCGTLSDAWLTPLADVGVEGNDRGKGGKYLLLPHDYRGPIPDGYFRVKYKTYNSSALFRIPKPMEATKTRSLIEKIRTYPLALADSPPTSKHISISEKAFDGLIPYDDSFFDSLARMVNEEPVQTRDLVAMGHLRSIGIEKGRAFVPDQKSRKTLQQAANQARLEISNYAAENSWQKISMIGPRSLWSFIESDQLLVDDRAAFFINPLAWQFHRRMK